jgi:hypothetical protein
VNVEVRDRLTRRHSIIDAEIETVRRMPLNHYLPCVVGEAQQLVTLCGRCLKPRGNVSPRN